MTTWAEFTKTQNDTNNFLLNAETWEKYLPTFYDRTEMWVFATEFTKELTKELHNLAYDMDDIGFFSQNMHLEAKERKVLEKLKHDNKELHRMVFAQRAIEKYQMSDFDKFSWNVYGKYNDYFFTVSEEQWKEFLPVFNDTEKLYEFSRQFGLEFMLFEYSLYNSKEKQSLLNEKLSKILEVLKSSNELLAETVEKEIVKLEKYDMESVLDTVLEYKFIGRGQYQQAIEMYEWCEKYCNCLGEERCKFFIEGLPMSYDHLFVEEARFYTKDEIAEWANDLYKHMSREDYFSLCELLAFQSEELALEALKVDECHNPKDYDGVDPLDVLYGKNEEREM